MKKTRMWTLMLMITITGCQETPTPASDGAMSDAVSDSMTIDGGDAAAPDASDVGEPDATVSLGPSCVTEVPAGMQNLMLCAVEGGVRHVRIEDIAVPRTHASAQLFLGLAAPTGSQTPLTAGQFKLQIYGGGSPQPAPQIGAYFGAESVALSGDHTFVGTPSTICFDVHDGSADARAAFVLWRDGENGADCHDRASLTLANAFDRIFAPSNGAIIKDANAYFYQAASVTASPTVTLFDTLAVADVAEPPPPSCATSIATTASARVVELCDIDGTVQHVRIEGVTAAATHASAQLLIGFDTEPAQDAPPTNDLDADQWKLQLYGGGATGPGASVGPAIDAFFGEHTERIGADASFVNAPSTICFDIHDGTSEAPPYFVLWRDGERGADCEDFETLTLATAFGMELAYGRTYGALDKNAPLYFYQSTHAATPTVTVFNAPALTADEARAGLECETTWVANAYWQELCAPAAGRARHIRIEDALSQMSSKYFYLVRGEPSAPADPLSTAAPANTVAGDGRFIFSGGWNHLAASATWLRFNGGSTAQMAYAVGETPLYAAPHTVCMDFGTAASSARLRVRLWASGAGGADCTDSSTLTAESALYDSETASSDTFWTEPLGATGLDFIKISGSTAGATLGRIVLSSEPAVY